jgi:SAM-dependent methyltransferase
MPHRTPVRPYHWLALYYDAFFSRARLPLDKARQQILNRILPEVRTACDLACGTGTTALRFAGMGIETYALDLSPWMCRAARAKAKAADLPVRVLHGDMRSFRLPRAVDLVTCEADAINHLPARRDLRRVARAVARALRPGGYFYFDVNNASGFRSYWTGTVSLQRPGVKLLMRNQHGGEAPRAASEVEWKIREGEGWRTHRERVEEVCWNDAEIQGILLEAGFDRIRRWDAAVFFGADSPVARGCRTHYLARKTAG